MNQRPLILHDYFETPDGGGRLCALLARSLEADLLCGFIMPCHPYFTSPPAPGRIMELGNFPKIPLVRQFLLARAFLQRADGARGRASAIYSGSYAPLAVLKHPARRNILYCHTPPRFLYDRRQDFLRLAPAALRPLMHAFLAWLRPRYEAAVGRMDVILANSENVRRRIRRHLARDSTVVHPPVDVASHQWRGQGDFYLSTARLDPLKRVDTIVEAFAAMPDKRLVVLSDGPLAPRLRRMAEGHGNITMTGRVDEPTLAELLGTCIATIYVPFDEDFGMSPVESMACGKPVIGVDEGGIGESVVHGETGTLLHPAFTAQELAKAVQAMDAAAALDMRAACEKRAQDFGIERFARSISDYL